MTGTRQRVTRWSVLVLVACVFGATALVRALEQASGSMPPPVTMTREADQARVMKELGITSIPHGPSSSSPDTYDESTANPYPTLPDPLVMNDGTRVASAAMWPTRRAEILELFEREVYGRTPTNTPKVTWEVKETTRGTNGDVPILTRQLVGHVDNSSYPAVTVDIEARVSTPANAPGPVPVILQFSGGFFYTGFTGRGGRAGRAGRAGAPAFRGPTGPTWQQQLLARGWGYASINTSSVQADNGGGLTQGIIGLVNRGQPRELDDWGALAAWSWGASRVLDYFETNPAVDATRVGLEGHSRWGKATLLAMALNPRFAIAYVSSSGAGGAKSIAASTARRSTTSPRPTSTTGWLATS